VEDQTDPAIAWTQQVANALEVQSMSLQDIEDVLALAGEVAHGTSQRSLAPLTTFLAGLYAAKCSPNTEPLTNVRNIVARILDGYDKNQ
jgi:hypothetical protein